MTPLLDVDDITVDYDGFKALDGMSLSLAAGERRVVVGPNGAGKSTLCDAIIGKVRPAAGGIRLRGEDITQLPEQAIVGAGICRKFQAPGVLAALSVADNVALACRRDKRWWRSFGTGIVRGEEDAIDTVLVDIGLAGRRDAPAGTLAHGEKQWLEIGMVIGTGADLVLLDEPTAGMGPAETSRTADLIRSLGGTRTVVVIDHDMSFVEQLDCAVTVMHRGQRIAEGTLDEIRADRDVQSVYLGHAA